MDDQVDMVMGSMSWSVSVVGVLLLAAGIVTVLIRDRMRGTFVTTEAHNELEQTVTTFSAQVEKMRQAVDERMTAFERRLSEVPLRTDVARISDRMAGVERDTAVTQANLVALKELVIGVGRNVDLLVQHHLADGK